ncbi:MAG: hypothetical protein DI604_28120 [Delftia acidovorans]|nr:MAG: hypothetical protein DI604_28120 [Delftia acidovorans]
MTKTDLYCCGCQKEVAARLTAGAEIYPHRSDLAATPYWRCDGCGNFVGCHHKTSDRTRPLGSIPTPEIRAARSKVHQALDPLWRSGRISRSDLYRAIGRGIGVAEFHTGELRTVEMAHQVQRMAKELEQQL